MRSSSRLVQRDPPKTMFKVDVFVAGHVPLTARNCPAVRCTCSGRKPRAPHLYWQCGGRRAVRAGVVPLRRRDSDRQWRDDVWACSRCRETGSTVTICAGWPRSWAWQTCWNRLLRRLADLAHQPHLTRQFPSATPQTHPSLPSRLAAGWKPCLKSTETRWRTAYSPLSLRRSPHPRSRRPSSVAPSSQTAPPPQGRTPHKTTLPRWPLISAENPDMQPVGHLVRQ